MSADESHLPLAEQSLPYRLRKRAEIRRNDLMRKSVREGRPDRVADLLEEAARAIDEAVAALAPFAMLADGYDPALICDGGASVTYPDDDSIVLVAANDFDPDWLNSALRGITSDEIQVGDLRRARALLSRLEQEP